MPWPSQPRFRVTHLPIDRYVTRANYNRQKNQQQADKGTHQSFSGDEPPATSKTTTEEGTGSAGWTAAEKEAETLMQRTIVAHRTTKLWPYISKTQIWMGGEK